MSRKRVVSKSERLRRIVTANMVALKEGGFESPTWKDVIDDVRNAIDGEFVVQPGFVLIALLVTGNFWIDRRGRVRFVDGD